MLKVRSKVKIVFPLGEQAVTKTMKKFHNKETTIKEEHIYRKKSSQFKSYILEDCKSDFGVDYEFCEEWLVPIESEVA